MPCHSSVRAARTWSVRWLRLVSCWVSHVNPGKKPRQRAKIGGCIVRLLICAGGTGGGVYPAQAVLQAIQGEAEVLWVVGEGGMETRLVERSGVPLRAIPAAGVHGIG